jgi:hypothetical protein
VKELKMILTVFVPDNKSLKEVATEIGEVIEEECPEFDIMSINKVSDEEDDDQI